MRQCTSSCTSRLVSWKLRAVPAGTVKEAESQLYARLKQKWITTYVSSQHYAGAKERSCLSPTQLPPWPG